MKFICIIIFLYVDILKSHKWNYVQEVVATAGKLISNKEMIRMLPRFRLKKATPKGGFKYMPCQGGEKYRACS